MSRYIVDSLERSLGLIVPARIKDELPEQLPPSREDPDLSAGD
jgi:hypothetical protein